MMQRLAFILVACCIAVSGCDDPRQTTRKVTTTELVGTWKLTPQTRALIKKHGYTEFPGEPLTITFNADGTLSFASVITIDEKSTYQETGGKWRLDHDATFGNNIKRANVLNIELKRPTDSYWFPLAVMESKSSLTLWGYFADPDSRDYIEYTEP